MSEDTRKSVVNRGKRTITLRPNPDGSKRILEPGKSIECIDEAEFKLLTGYHDIADVDKIVPQVAAREAKLREELKTAQAENERLKQLKESVDLGNKSEKGPKPQPKLQRKKKGK